MPTPLIARFSIEKGPAQWASLWTLMTVSRSRAEARGSSRPSMESEDNSLNVQLFERNAASAFIEDAQQASIFQISVG